jgi:heptosyltransferase II
LKQPKLEPGQISRIVVRAPNWLGDVVMSVPALRQLRCGFPQSHISVVTRAGSADIFLEADFVDDVLIANDSGWRSVRRQVREWRRRNFDLGVLLQNAFQSAAISFLAQVRIRIGYKTDRRGALLTHAVQLPAWKNERHEIYYYLNLISEVERLAGNDRNSAQTDPDFSVFVSEERKKGASEILQRHGIRPGLSLALLCPGSINSRAKRWPAERYAALADLFSESGAQVALIGSVGETDVSRSVLVHARHQPIVLTGKTSVAEVTSIISLADILITNDTGPAHIGAAVGTPTLVVFGPTNPATTRPFAPNSEIIRVPPDCAPCMLRDCPIDHRCMTAIEPREVFARAQRMLLRERAQVIA